ncbi:nuclear pore complex protein DDB_G0274915 [Neocloeon triangulifer]|uniref:nuclear pore complex protein DDB_G0274915 n=1 Tax=Neocloeon triangulifer TaxID=2078957 RepID=UPI00286FA5DF|nr:nuclear pore complex protein DDB_G0274915 [Neocloeon triangulifer]
MIEQLRRPRNAAVLALVLGVVFNYLLNSLFIFIYLFLLAASFGLTVCMKRFGIAREQIFDLLHLPANCREFINGLLPARDETRHFGKKLHREIPESFRFVGADLFHENKDEEEPRRVEQQQLSPASTRQRTRIVRTVQSSPGPALSSTRFRSNLDFSLNAEVNSPGFANRIVSYHHQESPSQDNPSSPRPQIGEFQNIKLNQEATPVRRVNLSSQVGLPLIITSPMAPPNIYNQCLPPEDKPSSMEPAPSVLEALKEISRKRISSEDNRPQAGMKRYKNDLINAAAEFPAIIKETVSSPSRVISKRSREVVDVSPETNQPTKQAKFSKCNEIEASLSSTKMYQKQRAEAKKKRAAETTLQEPETKTVRTEEPVVQKTPEVVIVHEERRAPLSLFGTQSPQKASPVKPAKRKAALEEIYSPIRLEDKPKTSKQLSLKELREKKLQSLLVELEDAKEQPDIVEVSKPEETSTPAFLSSPVAIMTSDTTVTTSIQGPVVSSTSPTITQDASSIFATPKATVTPLVPSTQTTNLPTMSAPSFSFGSTSSTTASPAVATFGVTVPPKSDTPTTISAATSSFAFGGQTAQPAATTTAASSTALATPSFNFGSSQSSATPPNPTALTFGKSVSTPATTIAAKPSFTIVSNASPLALGKQTTPAASFNFGSVAANTAKSTTTATGFSFGNTTNASAAPSPFGATVTSAFAPVTTTSTTPSFGTPTTCTTSIFGTGTGPTFASGQSLTFGTSTATTFGTPTSKPPPPFGSQTLFGSTATTSTPFGATSVPSAVETPSFGVAKTTASFGSGTSTFGTSGTTSGNTAPPPAYNAFGTEKSAGLNFNFSSTTSATPAANFGTATTTPAFGNPTEQAKTASSGFGNFSANPTTTTTPFGVTNSSAAPSPFGFNTGAATTTNQPMFNSPFKAATTSASSLFGTSSFSKAELAPLPTNFKFGDKTDTSPKVAANIFGVPSVQNPFGGASSGGSGSGFGFNQAAANPGQQSQTGFNFSAAAAPQQQGAFGFGAPSNQPQQQQQQQFGFAASQPQQFQATQQTGTGGFSIGTSSARRQLQARRRR